MNEDFLSNLNHDLSFRPGIIREALEKGVQFGTKEFFVYSQLRWYETDGKFGFCVAGNERLGEDVGMTAKEVKDALRGLKDAGLVEHVWCDKKAYRNKTKLWLSTVRLAGVCTNVDAIRVLKKGAKNTAILEKTTSGNAETGGGNAETGGGNAETGGGNAVASPVITGVGNTNRNTNKKHTQKNLQKNFFNDGFSEGIVVNPLNQSIGKSVNQVVGKENLNVNDVTRDICNSVNSNKKLKNSENPVNSFVGNTCNIGTMKRATHYRLNTTQSVSEAYKTSLSVNNIEHNIEYNTSSQAVPARKATSEKETKVKVLNTSLSNLYRILEIEEPKNQIEIKRVNKLYGIAKHSYSDEQLVDAANNIAKRDKKYRSINSVLLKTNENLDDKKCVKENEDGTAIIWC